MSSIHSVYVHLENKKFRLIQKKIKNNIKCNKDEYLKRKTIIYLHLCIKKVNKHYVILNNIPLKVMYTEDGIIQ